MKKIITVLSILTCASTFQFAVGTENAASEVLGVDKKTAEEIISSLETMKKKCDTVKSEVPKACDKLGGLNKDQQTYKDDEEDGNANVVPLICAVLYIYGELCNDAKEGTNLIATGIKAIKGEKNSDHKNVLKGIKQVKQGLHFLESAHALLNLLACAILVFSRSCAAAAKGGKNMNNVSKVKAEMQTRQKNWFSKVKKMVGSNIDTMTDIVKDAEKKYDQLAPDGEIKTIIDNLKVKVSIKKSGSDEKKEVSCFNMHHKAAELMSTFFEKVIAYLDGTDVAQDLEKEAHLVSININGGTTDSSGNPVVSGESSDKKKKDDDEEKKEKDKEKKKKDKEKKKEEEEDDD
jgi:hypothetical protein